MKTMKPARDTKTLETRPTSHAQDEAPGTRIEEAINRRRPPPAEVTRRRDRAVEGTKSNIVSDSSRRRLNENTISCASRRRRATSRAWRRSKERVPVEFARDASRAPRASARARSDDTFIVLEYIHRHLKERRRLFPRRKTRISFVQAKHRDSNRRFPPLPYGSLCRRRRVMLREGGADAGEVPYTIAACAGWTTRPERATGCIVGGVGASMGPGTTLLVRESRDIEFVSVAANMHATHRQTRGDPPNNPRRPPDSISEQIIIAMQRSTPRVVACQHEADETVIATAVHHSLFALNRKRRRLWPKATTHRSTDTNSDWNVRRTFRICTSRRYSTCTATATPVPSVTFSVPDAGPTKEGEQQYPGLEHAR